jgi:hypothetical protein
VLACALRPEHGPVSAERTAPLSARHPRISSQSRSSFSGERITAVLDFPHTGLAGLPG